MIMRDDDRGRVDSHCVFEQRRQSPEH
jgi:hypothetical protein